MLAGLFKGTVRIVAIIVLSVILLSSLGYAAYAAHEAYKSHQSAPYEAMKTWTRPIQHPLDMSLTAKTKVVNGQLFQSYELKGWPAYMTDPSKTEKNKQAVITFLYYDKDGFVMYEKKVSLIEFSLRVGEDGGRVRISVCEARCGRPASWRVPAGRWSS